MTGRQSVEVTARTLLDQASGEAARTEAWARMPEHRNLVRSAALEAVRRGGVSPYQDPVVRVRCSDLTAVCERVLGIEPAPSIDTDQLELFEVRS